MTWKDNEVKLFILHVQTDLPMFKSTYPLAFLKSEPHILDLAHLKSDNFEQAFET